MKSTYTWDEAKRQRNIAERGLDFADADLVLLSRYRFDVPSPRDGEMRVMSFAYVFDVLHVLLVVHAPGAAHRIISYRAAHPDEREIYHDWLANDFHDAD
jgi:uncharacterized DUF497 family protein